MQDFLPGSEVGLYTSYLSAAYILFLAAACHMFPYLFANSAEDAGDASPAGPGLRGLNII